MDDKILTPLDALEIALREEKKAHQFYLDCARMVGLDSTRKMFEHLAREEARHVRIVEEEIDRAVSSEN